MSVGGRRARAPRIAGRGIKSVMRARPGNLVAVSMAPFEDPDLQIRLAAFEAIGLRVARHGPTLPWSTISEGFEYQGERVFFAGRATGIFRPKQMRAAALSIKTVIPRKGRTEPYEDREEDGAFIYRLERNGPDSRYNVLLREAHQLHAPLIYFKAVEPSLYRPVWPVFVDAMDQEGLQCRLVADDPSLLIQGPAVADRKAVEIRRAYVTVQAKRRLHQDRFRVRVLDAYGQRCAVCRLPRPELLDAAHIVPDKDVRGVPAVHNGLALCRLHHGAFDTHLMGINPDGIIDLSPALLETRDGPTLQHALHGFHRQPLQAPRHVEDRPSRDLLAARYELFLRAS
ncbi:MAG TPA: HNH endonuclease [Myxococcaceae bacterium]|nr:HNH endonuclease [Myxococcaceae bacterium]